MPVHSGSCQASSCLRARVQAERSRTYEGVGLALEHPGKCLIVAVCVGALAAVVLRALQTWMTGFSTLTDG